MSTETQRTLLASNEEYARAYTQGNLPIPPSKKVAIVTCMDARLSPTQLFSLPLGSANIIRNAGGSARDAFRSLLLSNHLLGTREIMVIKHTRCGLLGATNEMGREVVAKSLAESNAGKEGDGVKEELEGMDFLPIKDLGEAVREDVKWLRGQKLVRGDVVVSGWVLDIDTGRVESVEE